MPLQLLLRNLLRFLRHSTIFEVVLAGLLGLASADQKVRFLGPDLVSYGFVGPWPNQPSNVYTH